jgi:hypothetical protein
MCWMPLGHVRRCQCCSGTGIRFGDVVCQRATRNAGTVKRCAAQSQQLQLPEAPAQQFVPAARQAPLRRGSSENFAIFILQKLRNHGILRYLLQERTPKIVGFDQQNDTRATSANYLAELL